VICAMSVARDVAAKALETQLFAIAVQVLISHHPFHHCPSLILLFIAPAAINFHCHFRLSGYLPRVATASILVDLQDLSLNRSDVRHRSQSGSARQLSTTDSTPNLTGGQT
jgi:hypothetical protein